MKASPYRPAFGRFFYKFILKYIMQPHFITKNITQTINEQHTSPVYVYSEHLLLEQAKKVLAFPHAFWLTVRYAMKANANRNILKLFHHQWIHIDASSGYEVIRALEAWIPGEHIQLSWQELPFDISILWTYNVQFVATSAHQLRMYGEMYPWSDVGIRINPGIWSWAFKKIDTWWPSSSFGIRHEQLHEIHGIAQEYQLTITKIHIHIWSENTAEARAAAAKDAIHLIEQFPDVRILNMGWWFKTAIMPYEKDADLLHIGHAVKEELALFAHRSWRKIHLEIEPGKYLVMNTCSLVGKVIDIVATWDEGYNFIKVNTWMTELPRFSMYGIQQPIHIYSENTSEKESVVVGHCCESGDLLTPMLYQSDTVEPIILPHGEIWDTLIVNSCGAYNASMSMKHYNSYPEAEEILLRKNGELKTIRKRQDPQEIWKHEIEVI